MSWVQKSEDLKAVKSQAPNLDKTKYSTKSWFKLHWTKNSLQPFFHCFSSSLLKCQLFYYSRRWPQHWNDIFQATGLGERGSHLHPKVPVTFPSRRGNEGSVDGGIKILPDSTIEDPWLVLFGKGNLGPSKNCPHSNIFLGGGRWLPTFFFIFPHTFNWYETKVNSSWSRGAWTSLLPKARPYPHTDLPHNEFAAHLLLLCQVHKLLKVYEIIRIYRSLGCMQQFCLFGIYSKNTHFGSSSSVLWCSHLDTQAVHPSAQRSQIFENSQIALQKMTCVWWWFPFPQNVWRPSCHEVWKLPSSPLFAAVERQDVWTNGPSRVTIPKAPSKSKTAMEATF